MKLIGLTGQSGAGKGAVASIFEKCKIPVINADAVYHEILARNDACTRELAFAFGEEILNADGRVERKKLASLVFGRKDTPDRLHTLNRITHKYVISEIDARLTEYQRSGTPAVVLDAPQLFEAGLDHRCATVIGVIANHDLRLARVMRRDDITQEQAEKRLCAQLDEQFFRARCTHILENNGTLAELEAATLPLIAALTEELP